MILSSIWRKRYSFRSRQGVLLGWVLWKRKGADIDGEYDGDRYGDYSGHSVSLNDVGTVVAIGSSPGATAGNIGKARVYEWRGAEGWIQRGHNFWRTSRFARFGRSVSLNSSGDTVAWRLEVLGTMVHVEQGSCSTFTNGMD